MTYDAKKNTVTGTIEKESWPSVPFLKVGDLVRLNSGGPAMKVTELHPLEVSVEWDGDKGKNSRAFPLACVTPVL
jgi:uncharacterized protein YodC (DUF2158 family)